MNPGLDGKVVLIVGASRGIGAAAAHDFANEHARLALLSRGSDDLERLAKELRRTHPAIEILTLSRDATARGCAEASVKEVVERFGRVDVLVNNAGAGLRRSFEELSEEDWAACLELNLMAAIRFSHAVLPEMKKGGHGRIVNLGAVSATRPRQGQIASNVAKAGLVNFTKSLAMEVASYNILVNAVCPGSVEGSRWRATPEDLRNAVSRRVPLGRTGRAEEVAGVIVFLAGDQASFITGAVINVDGGLAAGISAG
jgi:NAD(P)-dependent dehydrogenase (short-subunit alcohol dehydrogenase family)